MKKEIPQYRDIHTIMSEHARRQPNKTYIINPDQGRHITFKQTNDTCNRICNFFKEQGLKANDRVSMVAENSIETLLIYFSILKYGVVINPLNVEESKENIYSLLNRAKPKIVFYGDELSFNQKRYTGGQWIPFSAPKAGEKAKGDFFASLKRYSPEFDSPSPPRTTCPSTCSHRGLPAYRKRWPGPARRYSTCPAKSSKGSR